MVVSVSRVYSSSCRCRIPSIPDKRYNIAVLFPYRCTRVLLFRSSLYLSSRCRWERSGRRSLHHAATYYFDLRPVHNTTLNNALRCVVFVLTLVGTQCDARIDLDPILEFPCVVFLRLVAKNPTISSVINLCVSRINATQDPASLCEPPFTLLNDKEQIQY